MDEEQITPIKGIPTEVPDKMVLQPRTAEILLRLKRDKVILFTSNDERELNLVTQQLTILATNYRFFVVKKNPRIVWIISGDSYVEITD